MALDSAVYLVTADIATRSGLIENRYRVADGRYVLDIKDLSRVRFTTDEYISGLEGVEKVDPERADTLIAENGYKMGYDGLLTNEESETVQVETESGEILDEQTINGGDVGNVEDILGGGTQQEEENNENNEETEQQNQEEE